MADEQTLAVETLTTERLIGQRLRAEDGEELRRLHQDARIMAALSADGGPLSYEETRQSLQRSLDHWERHGYGTWMFRDRADGRFVGYCGLKSIDMDGAREVELLYAVMSAYWGRGLATEMAEAVLKVAFERLGLVNVVAYTLSTNRASRRVMEKVGFEYERDIVHAGLPHVLYRLSRGGARWGRSTGG